MSPAPAPRHLILIKHALPTIDPAAGPSGWTLAPEGRADCAALALLEDRDRALRPARRDDRRDHKSRAVHWSSASSPPPIGMPRASRIPTPSMSRAENKHLAFGQGAHYCVGALTERLPDLRLAVDPSALRWRGSFIVHGLAALPVRA